MLRKKRHFEEKMKQKQYHQQQQGLFRFGVEFAAEIAQESDKSHDEDGCGGYGGNDVDGRIGTSSSS